MLTKFLVAIGLLLALAVAAVLIVPSLIDWNSYKQDIAARVQQATGRDLAITGDISLRVLPVPTLSVEGVRFANMEGGSAPEMATFDALRVRVAPWPLLQGRVQVERVELVNPTILLETSSDGRSNWVFDAGGTPGADAPDGAPGGELEVSLDRVSIENGTLVYRDARRGTERTIDRLDADIAAETLSGPFRATGRAVVGGDSVAFDLRTGRLLDGEAAGLGVSLRLPEADATLRFAGSAVLQGADSRIHGTLNGTAPDLGRLLADLSDGVPGADLPVAARGSLEARGTLDATATAVALTDLSFRIGEVTGSGTVDVAPGAPVTAKATIALNRVDLEALFAAGGAAGPASEAPESGRGKGFALPEGFDAELDMTVAALTYRDGLINNLRLAATLSDGVVTLDPMVALLPGGSDVLLAGRLDAADGAPRFAGSIEASATNFRGLLKWLRIDVADVPSERLRNMSVVSRIAATPSRLEFSDIDLRLDASRVRGGVVVALPAGPGGRPGFGIGLAVDQVDLDAYRAAAPRADASAGAVAAVDRLAPLADLAANLDLRFGRLTYNRQTLRDVRVHGTVQNGNLTLRELSVEQFAGGQANLSGTITDLAGSPRFETRFDLAAEDAGRALRLAGLTDAPPEDLGALTLGGTLSGEADEVAYDVSFSLAGLEAEGRAEGTAAGFAAGTPRLDTRFEIAARDPVPLLRLAGVPGADRPGEAGRQLGAVSIAGSAATGADGLSYDLSVTAAGIGGRGRLTGTLADLAATPRIDARLEAEVEQPAPLLMLAGRRAPTPPPGPLSLVARAEGTVEALTISDLTVEADPSRLTGRIDIDNSGARPRLRADLRGQELALGWLAAGAAGDGTTDAPAGDAESGGRWSDQPIDLSALEALDAEVDLAADALLLGETRLEEARLSLGLDRGVLDIKSLQGKVYGGSVELTGQLANQGVPSATARLAATDLAVARLLPDGAVGEQVRGPLSINADLRAKGVTLADMIGALQGTGDLAGTLTVLAPAEQQIGSALLGVLGARIEEVRGVTERIDALYSAFTGSPNALDGSFRIENGVLRTDDATLAGNGARAAAAGTADLEAWVLDMTVRVRRPQTADDQTADEPFLVVDLQGPIDAPDVNLGGAALSAVGSPEGGSGLTRPEDALRGLIERAVPGLSGTPADEGADEPSAPAGDEPVEDEPAGEEPAEGEAAEGGAAAGRDEPPAASEPADSTGFGALLPKILEELRQQ